MAKKKIKKEIDDNFTITSSGNNHSCVVIETAADTQILKLTHELKAQAEDIYKLNQRIDRIVIAHNKCKSLKGL